LLFYRFLLVQDQIQNQVKKKQPNLSLLWNQWNQA